MRVSKDGKLKLSKDERQYGNFVFKNEEEYVKICDINSNLTHRVSKSLNIGQMMAIALKEKQTIWLGDYAKLVWTFSNIVTDEQFFLDIDRVCGECINRHPELYGIEPNISAKEDAKILQESKEVHEAIEELKKEE